MAIDDHDLYYGTALKQIADHKLFKSINAEWQANKKSRCAYRINMDIGVYIRAATKPVNGEYVFNFKKENTDEMTALEGLCKKGVFVVLVCYNAKAISKGARGAQYRQICVLRPSQISALIKTRGAGIPADAQHNILITVPHSKSMRARITIPGREGGRMELTRKIPRNAFPNLIFK
jgi:hypothetical protein